MKKEDREFTFSCEFERDANVDDIGEPDETGKVPVVEETTPSTIEATSAEAGGNENQTEENKAIDEDTNDKAIGTALINSIPFTLLLGSYLV